MPENLTGIKCCIEKPTEEEESAITHITENSNSDTHNKHIRAAFFKSKIWPSNSTITIQFLESDNGHSSQPMYTPLNSLESRVDKNNVKMPLDPLEKSIRDLSPINFVKKIITDRIQPMVNLKFRFARKGELGTVRISFDPAGGAWSMIGTDHLSYKDKSSATMNFGWLDVGTCIHEFGHLLGMIHEHQNPKGSKIPWDEDKVYAWARQTQGWDHETTYSNIIMRYNIDQINGSQFDPTSIMEYFYSPDLTTNNQGEPMNSILSPTDVKWIMDIYPPNSGLTPKEFYKNVYNLDVDKPLLYGVGYGNVNESSSSSSYIIIIVIILVIVGIVSFIWYKKNVNNSPKYKKIDHSSYNNSLQYV
jgi:hypothetical protein